VQCKELYFSLEQELRTDYGLSVIESRALVQRVAEFVEHLHEDHHELRGPGQVRYVAVAQGQPAGRPLSQCVTVPVLLTVVDDADAGLLVRQGSVALRRARLQRLSHQAQKQGALLSYEDLALLLGVDTATIRRQVAQCRKAGLAVPTRGQEADIGPGVSHRSRVIALLFRGLQPAAIASYTAHALSSVERYIADFARVVELLERGYPSAAIARITALSPRTVRDHMALAQQYADPAYQPVMRMLRQRFGSPLSPEEDTTSWEPRRKRKSASSPVVPQNVAPVTTGDGVHHRGHVQRWNDCRGAAGSTRWNSHLTS
jgi:hypothetical protein